LVLLRGDDLLGGPACGIVAGRGSLVEAICQQPTARLVPLSPLVAASLLATLALYEDRAKVRHRIPLLELLTASRDNLKNRAERMAPQLAACPGIVEAVAIELEGHLRPASATSSLRIPGWGVALRAAESGGSPAALQQRLFAGPIKVVATATGDKVLVNLRSLPARQDLDVMAALESPPAEHP
jgi:L-seryl-tRNA(Ser) seleniumtransferase